MKLFNKQEVLKVGSSIKRIKSMETSALKSWFDSTLLGLGSAYDQWRFHEGPEGPVTEHLEALQELWKELQCRDGV
jgi:hypothetical protein